jgi:hypothetical protein
MTTIARMSSLSKTFPEGYQCKHEWPEDCVVQAGDSGIVFTNSGAYRTAFFEAFPINPNTFIRGEGETVEVAESDCWSKWMRISVCPEHEFERRGYHNGYGVCKRCGMGGMVFEPDVFCCICGKPTFFTQDSRGLYYCQEHQRDKLPEFFTDIDWMLVESEDEKFKAYGHLGPITHEDIKRLFDGSR